MKLGIVGLPNVGKSTLFNAITNAGAQSANYPFCTIDPNVGIVSVPDERLDVLSRMHNSKKTTPAVIEFVDIAGLVKGASRGEGLGNKFLSHIREVDAIVHVVRCFEDPNIVHVDGSIDPLRDIDTINLELIFSDLEMVERRIERTKKSLKGDKSLQFELDLLEDVRAVLNAGKSAKTIAFTKEQAEIMKSIPLLSLKPVIYAANLSEDDFKSGYQNNKAFLKVQKLAQEENTIVLPICARLEEEILELEDDEKKLFLEELGIKQSGLDALVRTCYSLLGLISYLTTGPDETRAWTIQKGTRAPAAAGKIHSDFERGFIRAEVVAFNDLVSLGSMNAAKEKGLIRSEGKEYEIKDGDVVLFRFNV